jgi:hypothetical protein
MDFCSTDLNQTPATVGCTGLADVLIGSFSMLPPMAIPAQHLKVTHPFSTSPLIGQMMHV